MDALDVVIVALGQMASFRGAEVSAATQMLFAKRLLAEGEAPNVIVGACRRLEARERAEGETAFPSLGTLLAECREVRRLNEIARQHALAELAVLSGHALPEGPPRDLTRDEAKAWVARLRRDVEQRRRAQVAPE